VSPQPQPQTAPPQERPPAVDPLRVTGCQNPTVGNIVRGDYMPYSENHGRTVYKRNGQAAVSTPMGGVNMLDVLVYYWDERDGPSFCGWWFGPKVGGDQVWAYCPETTATPPQTQWKVPYDGPEDPTFTVSPLPGPQAPQPEPSAPPQQPYGAQSPYQQQGYSGQQQPYGGPPQQRPGAYDANADWRRQQEEAERQRQMQMQHQQAQEAERRRQEEELRRREAEARRMQQEAELRRQQDAARAAEEARRMDEERRRREIEAQHRRMEEERRRREEEHRRIEQERIAREEAERRRVEDERRKQEQAAMLAIRKVIQRVRLATEENFASLKAELEQAMIRECANCGSSQARIREEAEQATTQAGERLRVAAEQRAEEERHKQRQEELVAGLLKELSSLVSSAEAKVETVKLKADPLLRNGGLPIDADIKSTCAAVSEARKQARASCKACTDFLVSRKAQVEEARMIPEETRQQLVPLQRRIHDAISLLAGRCQAAEQAGQRALRKQNAVKTWERRDLLFKRYDKDGDGRLNGEEIVAYAKGEYGFDVPKATVDKVLKLYGGPEGQGVPKDQLQRVRTAVGIAREEANSRLRREEAERRRQELKLRKKELRGKLEAAEAAIEASGKAVDAAEAALHGLPPEVQKAMNATPVEVTKELAASADLQGLAERTTAAVGAAEARLRATRAELTALADQAAAGEQEIRDFLRSELRGLSSSAEALGARLEKSTHGEARLRELARKKDLAKLDHVRGELAGVLRRRARGAGQTFEELFAAADGDKDGAISTADLLTALSSGPEAQPEGGLDRSCLEKLFLELAEAGSAKLNKEEFLELTKVYYKVCRQTVLTEGVSIKESKTIRRIEEGEVIEVQDEPVEEDKAKVMRVRGRAMKDAVEGYISIAGNQGTKFLEEGGDLFRVVKAVDITQALVVEGAVAVRSLKEGELLQALKWERRDAASGTSRMKVKARADGVVGWVTVAGSEGTAFVKPA